MTKFVESFSTEQMLPPWKSKGAKFWGFVIRVKPRCIQDYLDDFFNEEEGGPSPYYYSARDDSHFGLLVVAEHADFSSHHESNFDPMDTRHRTVNHREIFWSVPACRHTRTADNLLSGEQELVWTQPFGFDDNGYVLFSSREIWGSERQMAQILMEDGPGAEHLHIDVAVQGFKKFSPRTRASAIGVMHILMDRGAAVEDVSGHIASNQDLAKFYDALRGTVPVLKDGEVAPPIQIDSLKQFRDVFDMDAATYRAIITSTAIQTNFRDQRLYTGEDVMLSFLWSGSMGKAFTRLFGIPEPGKNAKHFTEIAAIREEATHSGVDWDMPYSRVPVEFAVSFTADVLFESGETLFTYGDLHI